MLCEITMQLQCYSVSTKIFVNNQVSTYITVLSIYKTQMKNGNCFCPILNFGQSLPREHSECFGYNYPYPTQKKFALVKS